MRRRLNNVADDIKLAAYVLRLAGGEVQELTEYLDTDLVNQVLDTPASG